MTVQLPALIETWFKASDAARPDDLAAAFSPDGEVRDEGETHRGRAAIAAWARGAGRRYRMRTEPLAATQADDRHTVIARVTGDFPGSPLDFTYRFVLADNGIRSLEIGL